MIFYNNCLPLFCYFQYILYLLCSDKISIRKIHPYTDLHTIKDFIFQFHWVITPDSLTVYCLERLVRKADLVKDHIEVVEFAVLVPTHGYLFGYRSGDVSDVDHVFNIPCERSCRGHPVCRVGPHTLLSAWLGRWLRVGC